MSRRDPGYTGAQMASRFVVAGLAALAASGCGGGGEAANGAPEQKRPTDAQRALDELDASARPPDDAEQIARVLEDRARALDAADGLALSATATGRQRARDRRSARRAKPLSIDRVRLVADDLETSGGRAKAKVNMSYRVRGMRRPVLTAREIVLRHGSAGWRVERDAPRREPLPWEIGDFNLTRAPHVVLLTPPGVHAERLSRGLAAAYRSIRRDLPARELPRSVLVIAARDAAQTRRLAIKIGRGVVALADVAVSWGPPPAFRVERVLAERMIVVDSRWRRLPEAERQMTLEHELTHTALNRDTSLRTPAWLVEGVAMYVSDDDRTSEARLRAAGTAQSTNLRRLCRPDSIIGLRGRRQAAAYAASSAAVEAIVQRYGSEALFKLYDAFNDSTLRGKTCAATADRALRRTLGMSLAQLDRAVAGG